MPWDWSPDGVHWGDETMDGRMAEDWLTASHLPDFASSDVYARVLELAQTDLDPQRGWRLLKTLVRLASSGSELFQIGADVLTAIVQSHEDLIGSELARLTRTDAKYRELFQGQIDTALFEFRRRWGLDTESPGFVG